MVQGQARIFTVGELARRTGLRPSAIRFYERRGIIPRPMRLPNGYRVYEEQALSWIALIRNAQALGITLREARQLVDIVRARKRPCDHARTLIEARLRTVESTLEQLETLRGELRKHLRRMKPGRCASSAICPVSDGSASANG